MNTAELESLLIQTYALLSVRNALKLAKLPIPQRTSPIVATILSNHKHLSFYQDPAAIECALETIDLPKILLGVDEREKNQDSKLAYEDLVVLETLKYFKNDFFKWVNKPECVSCGQDGDNMEALGGERPAAPGPHLIGVIERYRCTNCNVETAFPRMNNPVSLLEFRKGRCGEWVNCFMLVLKAVLGEESRLRYVWNHEDHVWCEYYSHSLKRWVHLDPCENALDEPSLYCNNWGKQMSWVIGIGDDYIIDLSSKYIVSSRKQIAKSLVADIRAVDLAIKRTNARIALELWHRVKANSGSNEESYTQFYKEYLVIKGQEAAYLKDPNKLHTEELTTPTLNESALKGRQSGSSAWTAARGESGD